MYKDVPNETKSSAVGKMRKHSAGGSKPSETDTTALRKGKKKKMSY